MVVRSGTGVWKSVTGLGKLQRRYLDPVSGQAGYFGIVEEGANTAIVTLRVKVENKKITEAEWLIARKGDPGLNGPAQPGQPAGNFFDPDNLTASAPPEKPVAREARSSREAMVAITNSYFDGITDGPGFPSWPCRGPAKSRSDWVYRPLSVRPSGPAHPVALARPPAR